MTLTTNKQTNKQIEREGSASHQKYLYRYRYATRKKKRE